ncbi:MAG: RNA-binding cell elongation regulator Jag/EloR [Cellulosilyticaceae bacterium]
MKFVEKVAKTVDSAITDALIELGATTDEVEIEIIEKGSKGFLGFGAKDAKIRVTVKELSNSDDDLFAEIMAPTKTEVKPVEVKKEVKKAPIVKEAPVSIEPIQTPKEPVKVPVQPSVEVTSKTTDSIESKIQSFLGAVLTEMGIKEFKIETTIQKEKVYVAISGEKMGMIIGKRGETLDSLQYLTNIVINKGHEDYVKVMIDTENYRARREETLQKLAGKLAKKASQTKRPVVLEPMNPYDRRIIHSALQDSKFVKTHSEGKEPFRKVVITPNNMNRAPKRA